MKVSQENYFVYIITNQLKTVLYIGVTNDLAQRIIEHYLNRDNSKTFAGRYHCHFLVYYEEFKYIHDAIERESELKKWSRAKKEALIMSMNPHWQCLNTELFGKWPPKELHHRKDV